MLDITDIIDKLPSKPHDPNRRTRPLNAITKIVVHYDAVHVPPAEYEALHAMTRPVTAPLKTS